MQLVIAIIYSRETVRIQRTGENGVESVASANVAFALRQHRGIGSRQVKWNFAMCVVERTCVAHDGIAEIQKQRC